MDTASAWRPSARRALPDSMIAVPNDAPWARDSDRTACALSRVSCRVFASTSRTDGATVQPSMSSAVLPLRPLASLRYERAVVAAIFFEAPVAFPAPLPPAARSRTYFVPDARSTTGSARRATPWTTGLISSLPLLMYRSAVFRLSVTRLVLCRSFGEHSVSGSVTGHSIRLDCQFDELPAQSKVDNPVRFRLASNCGARVLA